MVCFQCNIFLLFLSLFIYIYYILVELTPSSYEVDPTSYQWGLSPVFCRVKSPQLPWVEFTLLGTNPYPPCPSPAPVESMIFRTFRSDMYPLPGVSKGRSSPSIWDTIGLLNPCCARSIWFWWQRSCSIMAWETWHTNRSSRLVYIGVEWSLSPCSFCTRRLRVNSTIFYRSTLPKNHWTFQWRGLNVYSRGVLVLKQLGYWAVSFYDESLWINAGIHGSCQLKWWEVSGSELCYLLVWIYTWSIRICSSFFNVT